jgi:hypothetical protein
LRASIDIENQNKAGRPPKITTTLGRKILRSLNSGEYKNAVDTSREMGKTGTCVNPQTIRNFLHQSNWKSMTKPNALPLTKSRKKARLDFAKKHKDWTVDDWRRVVFYDESKINRLGSDGKQWTWVKDGAPLQDHNVNHLYKHGGGSVFVWACITAHDPGYITRIEGGLGSQLYCQILDDDMLKSLEWYGIDPEDIIFQQGNDPKHTSKLAREWFQSKRIEVLDWPAYSPDCKGDSNHS